MHYLLALFFWIKRFVLHLYIFTGEPVEKKKSQIGTSFAQWYFEPESED